jgi:large subunit ribosomal protein L13
MKTSTLPPPAPQWHLVDAAGKSAGRLAARIAHILRGKHRPSFSPHQLLADHVIVINTAKLSYPAGKARRRVYRTHTGYIGHLREIALPHVLRERPGKIIEHAVKGMLPRNRLRALMLKRLHVFPGSEHPYGAQKAVPLSLR